MASIRTASRYWSTLVLLVSIGLIGGYAYYVHQQVGLDRVLSLPLDRLSPLLAGFAALAVLSVPALGAGAAGIPQHR